MTACEGPRRSSELDAQSAAAVAAIEGFLERGRLSSADSLLAASGPLERRSPELQYWSAQFAARMGDSAGAETALTLAAASGKPIAHEAQFELGLLASSRGDHETALARCREVLDAHPAHDASLVLAASSAIELERYHEAEHFAGALPESPMRWSLLGQIHLLRGENDQARPFLLRAHEAAPDRASTSYLLARLHLEDGDSTALALLRPLARSEPPFADSRSMLALGLEAHGYAAEAARWRELERRRLVEAELDARRAEAYELAEKRDWEGALKILEDAEAAHPDVPRLLNDIGAVLTQLKRYDEAEPKFLRAIELKPDDASIHGNLAQLYLLMGDEQRAEEHARLFQELGGGQ